MTRFKEPVSLTTRERQLLTLIRQSGFISRADLIKRSGLGGVPVFRGTEDLARKGLILVGEAVASGRGQPSSMVSLRPSAAFSAGLSIMTDSAEAILMDFTGQVRARRDLTNPGMNRTTIVDGLMDFLRTETKSIGTDMKDVCGLGLSVTGFFVRDGRQMNTPIGVDDWALVDLETEIEAATGLLTIIENSASAAAVGEYVLGWGADIRSFAYLNVTAGFGAGIILDGKLYRGKHGNAGEMGLHQVAGLPYTGLSSLKSHLEEDGLTFPSISEMLTVYDDTWPGVQTWVDCRAPTFRLIAHALRYVLDIDSIIIGGRAPVPLLERIANTMTWIEDDAVPRRQVASPAPQVRIARLPGVSAAIGAATLPFMRTYFA